MQLFGNKKHLNTRQADNQQSESPSVLQLIEQARNGDRKAQKSIYDALSTKMYAVCIRYMGDRESAQDVLQDGFVTLFTKLDSYGGNGSFEGWARKIFVNTALMNLRKNDVLRESEDVDSAWNAVSPATSAIQDIGYSELMKLISELSPGFRTVFNMFAIEGYSHREIAEQLDISEATSRTQFQRARIILQHKIEKLRD